MKLTQAVSSTLLVALTELLQGAQTDEYGLIELSAEWETKTLDALDPEFVKTLKKSLDGRNLITFVREQLRLIQAETDNIKLKPHINLTSVKCFSDALKVARRITKNLENIPTQYRLIVQVCAELADLLAAGEVDLPLSDRLKLVSGARLPKSFKAKHSNDALDSLIRGPLLRSEVVNIHDTGLYLEYRASGYLAGRRPSKIIGDFYDEIRAFYGACIAHEILSTYSSFGYEEIQPYIIANSVVDDVETFAYFERAEEDVPVCKCGHDSSDRQSHKEGRRFRQISWACPCCVFGFTDC